MAVKVKLPAVGREAPPERRRRRSSAAGNLKPQAPSGSSSTRRRSKASDSQQAPSSGSSSFSSTRRRSKTSSAPSAHAQPGFDAQAVEIRDDERDEVVRGYLYLPPELTEEKCEDVRVSGLCVFAPGSGGGLGPGLTVAPQPFANAATDSAHGGIYMRLGKELAAGRECRSWEDCYDCKQRRRGSAEVMGRGELGEGWSPPNGQRIVTLQIDWTTIPRGKLRRLKMLRSSVADIVVASSWLCNRFPGVPLIIVGFSFGGPSMWPAAVQLQQLHSSSARHKAALAGVHPGTSGDIIKIAGMVSIAGSARGGDDFISAGLATVECIRALGACASASEPASDRQRPRQDDEPYEADEASVVSEADGEGGEGEDETEAEVEGGGATVATSATVVGNSSAPVPCLFLHGTHDKNVALQVAEHLYAQTRSPKCLARVNFAPHMFDNARDLTHPFLRDWISTAIAHFWEQPPQRQEQQAFPFQGHVRLGRSLKLRANEFKGQERWRQKPCRKHMQKIRCDEAHPLAGLLGYSE